MSPFAGNLSPMIDWGRQLPFSPGVDGDDFTAFKSPSMNSAEPASAKKAERLFEQSPFIDNITNLVPKSSVKQNPKRPIKDESEEKQDSEKAGLTPKRQRVESLVDVEQ